MKYQAYDLYTRKITIQFFLGALSILFTGAINAQNTEAEDISELPTITVTANKQSETLATVTGSITAFDGNDLENIGARSLADVATMTPSFSFQETGQSTLSPPVIRGMTANIISFSSSAVLLVDGVPTLHAWGFGDRLFGVERVEVLRGPQSTLYGRNAEAGVVNVVTRLPDMHPHTFVSADLGSHGKKVLRADISRMLVENRLYASFAGETTRQDGFIDNVFTGKQTTAPCTAGALHYVGRLALQPMSFYAHQHNATTTAVQPGELSPHRVTPYIQERKAGCALRGKPYRWISIMKSHLICSCVRLPRATFSVTTCSKTPIFYRLNACSSDVIIILTRYPKSFG